MRVVCSTIEETIERLKADGPGNTYNRELNVSKTREPIEGDRRGSNKAVRFRVTLHMSAVVNRDEQGGQFLVECGEDCGVDYEDSVPETQGSQRAFELETKIRQFAADCGLKVKPGILRL